MAETHCSKRDDSSRQLLINLAKTQNLVLVDFHHNSPINLPCKSSLVREGPPRTDPIKVDKDSTGTSYPWLSSISLKSPVNHHF